MPILPTFNPSNHPEFWGRVSAVMHEGVNAATAYQTVYDQMLSEHLTETTSGNSITVVMDDLQHEVDDIAEEPFEVPMPQQSVSEFLTGPTTWPTMFNSTTGISDNHSTLSWHNSSTQEFQAVADSISAPVSASQAIRRGMKIKTISPSEDKTKMTLQQLYSYQNLNIQKNVCVEYEKTHTIKEPQYDFITTHGMVGIEVEVENITNGVPISAYWAHHSDGSLRNHGAEFVTVPLHVKQIQLAVEHLYECLKTNKYDFSNRTSIHVHLNCRDMTQDQVYTMVLLYAIFEKYFYSFAGQKRLNSIFCVPLFRCNMVRQIKEVIYSFSPSWHKYCGINLLPLVDHDGQRAYGTIEFRHLYGTDNKKELYDWINAILSLRYAAMNTITKDELLKEIESMNTSSSYLHLFARVFPNEKMRSNGKEFEECVSNIKREIWRGNYLSTLIKKDRSEYWTTIEKLGIRG